MTAIDWAPLHRILARRAMTDWGMSASDLYELQDLLKSGVTKEQIIRYVLDRFPNWSGRANELDVILDYAEASE